MSKVLSQNRQAQGAYLPGLLCLILLCSSCATIITGQRSNVQIKTSRNTDLVVNGDTIRNSDNKPINLRLRNSKLPLPVSVLDNDDPLLLGIAAVKPNAYAANFFTYPFYFAGFVVDEVSGLKWRYPRYIYIDVDQNSYLPYHPMPERLFKKKNKLTLAPFSPFQRFHPGFEIGYERSHGKRFATQITYAQLTSLDNEYARNTQGFKASIEEKYFVRNQETVRFYIALVLEHHYKTTDAFMSFVRTDAQGNDLVPFERFTQEVRVKKNMWALTPRIGAQKYITDRLIGELFLGMGLRWRDVSHENAPPNTRQDEEDSDILFFDVEHWSNRARRNTGLNFDFNLRLAWVF